MKGENGGIDGFFGLNRPISGGENYTGNQA